MSTAEATLQANIKRSHEALDAWVREVIEWHFAPATGCPFWLDYARTLSWDPRQEIQSYEDLSRLGPFQDEWLRGGPMRRWVPKGYIGRPIYTFETGGSTGVPKSRINIEDFRLDYEAFSTTLPDKFFPKSSDWLSLGPTGPRRLRLDAQRQIDVQAPVRRGRMRRVPRRLVSPSQCIAKVRVRCLRRICQWQ